MFFVGLFIGAIVAFPLGINFGKGAPLLSNPFAKRDIKTKVTTGAKKILEGAKEGIHEATKPEAEKAK
jgi:hypothetical protein